MICSRCQGHKAVINMGHQGEKVLVTCPICLGLGTYEQDEDWRPPKKSDDLIAIHSTTLTIEDVIDFLPEREAE